MLHAFVRGAGVAVFALALAASGSARAQEEKVAGMRARLKAAPDDPAAALALGKALRRAGRAVEAAQVLERGAPRSRGEDAAALRWEAVRARIDAREIDKALAGCKGLADAPAAACRAEVHLVRNRASLALPEARHALAADPTIYEGRLALGRALAFEGQTADAEAALRAAVASADARPEAHHRLGLLLVDLGRRAPGVAELRRARSADPDDPVVALDLAAALGSTVEARDALVEATRARPGYAEAQTALARVALDLGDVASGEAAAREAVRLDPSLSPAHAALGRALVARLRFDEALREAEAARRLVPRSAPAELVAADAYAGKGDLDLAVEAYQKAAALDRTDPAPLVRAAAACLAAGRATTARGFADKATADHPGWGPAWVALGDVLAAMGEKPAAIAAWDRSLEVGGTVDRAAVARRIAAAK